MKEEDTIRNLGSRARMEVPPQVDVVDSVMDIIRGEPNVEAGTDAPLTWIAALASASAIAVGVMAFVSLESWTDTLMGLFIDLPWGML